jgi:methyl halide transferase
LCAFANVRIKTEKYIKDGNLKDMKESAHDSSRIRVLVPGCGRGYSLRTFKEYFGSRADVLGIEISETAKTNCEKYLREQNSGAKCVVDDFFSHEPNGGLYDLAYDCTFLCAIQPTQRESWAERYSKLVKPGGKLISLVFPLGDFEGGPPFALTPETVQDLVKASFDVEQLIKVDEKDYARGRPEFLYVFTRKNEER